MLVGHLLADAGDLAHLEYDLLYAAPDRKITTRRTRAGKLDNAVSVTPAMLRSTHRHPPGAPVTLLLSIRMRSSAAFAMAYSASASCAATSGVHAAGSAGKPPAPHRDRSRRRADAARLQLRACRPPPEMILRVAATNKGDRIGMRSGLTIPTAVDSQTRTNWLRRLFFEVP